MLFLNHIFHATLGILGILMVGWALAGLVSGNLAMISRRHTWLLNGPSLWLGALSLISMATGFTERVAQVFHWRGVHLGKHPLLGCRFNHRISPSWLSLMSLKPLEKKYADSWRQ